MYVCHCVNYDATLVLAKIVGYPRGIYTNRDGTILSTGPDSTPVPQALHAQLPTLPDDRVPVICPHCNRECEWICCPRCGDGHELVPDSTGAVRCRACHYDGSVREICLLAELEQPL